MPEVKKPCKRCKDQRHNNGQPSRILVELPNRTEKQGLEVLVCPHCDGPVAAMASQNT